MLIPSWLAPLKAQSIIPNGGFEEYRGVGHSRYWTQTLGEFNHFYHQDFLPDNKGAATGKGYHCLCMYGMDENEFMHIALQHKLEPGRTYKLSMMVRMSNTGDQVHKNDLWKEVKRLDWYFTSIPINVLNKLFITAEPSASFPFKAQESLGWTYMSTEYTATGEEQFLTIGNITRLYEKIKRDQLLDSLKTALLSLEEDEIREMDSVRSKYMSELAPINASNEEEYSMNSLVEKKKKKRRKRRRAKEQEEWSKSHEIGSKIGEGQTAVKKKYYVRKDRLIYAIETTKKSYAVNVCFDDINMQPMEKTGPVAYDLWSSAHLQTGKTIVLKNVQFNTDAFDLLPGTTGQLDELVSWMKSKPGVKVQISGHTDNTGTEKHNLELSANRAKAVMNYLLSRGIAPHQISYAGYGSQYALADNTTAVGRALNRRVEFTVL